MRSPQAASAEALVIDGAYSLLDAPEGSSFERDPATRRRKPLPARSGRYGRAARTRRRRSPSIPPSSSPPWGLSCRPPLRAVRKGGRVVCGGIHMSDVPSFPYRILWEERQLVSVANLTRRDAAEFLAIAPRAGVKTETIPYPLEAANEALADLREGRLQGAAVLVP